MALAPAESKMALVIRKELPHNLQPKDQIIITGNVKAESGSFKITLQCGSEGQIALDINANFDATSLTLCDALSNRTRKIFNEKFSSGTEFEIIIYVKEEFFEVTFNKKHSLEFKPSPKLPFNHIQFLEIMGDVNVDKRDVKVIKYERPIGIHTSN